MATADPGSLLAARVRALIEWFRGAGYSAGLVEMGRQHELQVRSPLRGSDGRGGRQLCAVIEFRPNPVVVYCVPRCRVDVDQAIADEWR